ncbi:hypothetical protein, partial [Pseudomonas aeruginosa]|uniref:hypothetical protein n=1 Tax=Pseudomonas aeruginosa TaxID=287 RepID=UPI001ABC3655
AAYIIRLHISSSDIRSIPIAAPVFFQAQKKRATEVALSALRALCIREDQPLRLWESFQMK